MRQWESGRGGGGQARKFTESSGEPAAGGWECAETKEAPGEVGRSSLTSTDPAHSPRRTVPDKILDRLVSETARLFSEPAGHETQGSVHGAYCLFVFPAAGRGQAYWAVCTVPLCCDGRCRSVVMAQARLRDCCQPCQAKWLSRTPVRKGCLTRVVLPDAHYKMALTSPCRMPRGWWEESPAR